MARLLSHIGCNLLRDKVQSTDCSHFKKSDMIQTDRETFHMMLHQIMERFNRIEDRLNRMNRQASALDGDRLLDNQDMCEMLGITKRTLARYRQKKLVTYYMIDGRTYYKASEIEAFLNQKGKRLPVGLRNRVVV